MTSTSLVHEAAPDVKRKESFWRLHNVRFYVALLLCLNFFSLGLMRYSLGIAMICMVNSTAIGILEDYDSEEGDTGFGIEKPPNNSFANSHCPITSYVRHEYEGEFIWDTEKQGMLFAALYWGSFTSLPGGWFADRYSPRHILLGSVLLNVVCSILTPIAAHYGGYAAMFILRLLMGFGQVHIYGWVLHWQETAIGTSILSGIDEKEEQLFISCSAVLFVIIGLASCTVHLKEGEKREGLQKPTVMAFAARWFPPSERSTAISLYTAGNQLANIVGMPLNAWLCHLKSVFGGWPLIFLTSGASGLLWCLIWYCSVTNRPETHKRISQAEQRYIITSLKSQNLRERKEAVKNIPWKRLLLSSSVLACCMCSFVNGLVVSTTSSYIPTYFMEVLHLDLYSNGLYSALPYVSQWLAKFFFATLADHLVKNRLLSLTASTKIFNSVGCIGTAIFLFSCSFLTCAHSFWAITYLCLSMACFAAYAAGYWTSMVSIAPVYTGTISSLATTTNQIGSIIAPYLVGSITVHGTRAEWQIIFAVLSAVLVLCGLFYAIYGTAEIQEWAKEAPCEKAKGSGLSDVSCSSPHGHECKEEALLTLPVESNV